MQESDFYRLFKACQEGLVADTCRIKVKQTPRHTAAHAMLARIRSHVAAIDVLYKSRLAVEAETLLRSAMETAFWLGGVARKQGFVDDDKPDDLDNDAERQRKSQATELLRSARLDVIEAEQLAELRRVSSGPKTDLVDLGDLLDESDLRGWYSFYRNLSDKAAHPSLNSLSRHLTEKPDGTVAVNTLDSNADWKSTLLLACNVMLLAKALRDEIFPPDSQDWTSPLHDRVLAATEALG